MLYSIHIATADQPVAPVYRYVHEKGDKYLYYTSSTVQIENYHLDTITPLFFVNSQVLLSLLWNMRLIYVQAMSQALMPMGGAHRHMKNFQIALKQVGKGKGIFRIWWCFSSYFYRDVPCSYISDWSQSTECNERTRPDGMDGFFCSVVHNT